MRRRLIVGASGTVAVVVVIAAIAEFAGAGILSRLGSLAAEVRPPILVGVLHSLSGPLEPFERPIHDATIAELERINAEGGIDGQMVKWVAVDGRSDPRTFASQARHLIDTEKVSVIFGGWTSESRKAIQPVVEERNSLLIYPAEFEGLEQSPRILYAGISANQQVPPAVRWAVDYLGVKRPFVLGSDEVWSRTVAAIGKDMLQVSGVEKAGEMTLPFGSVDVEAAVAAIAEAKPDCILNFLIGESNTALFPALRRAGLTAKKVPVISFRISEEDGRRISPDDLAGHYAASEYFSTIETEENREFLRLHRARSGEDHPASAPAVRASDAVLLWAKAVTEAGDFTPERVIDRFPRLSLDAPDGVISVEPIEQAVWRPIRIAQARNDGLFDVVWSITRPTRPLTYAITRPRPVWDRFLDDLHAGWQGGWSGDSSAKGPRPGN